MLRMFFLKGYVYIVGVIIYFEFKLIENGRNLNKVGHPKKSRLLINYIIWLFNIYKLINYKW